MPVYLPDLEPFYNTKEFLVDLQSGELFVKLNGKWHPAGLTCEKRNFKVDGLMALIQHASIRLKNKIYGRKRRTDSCFDIGPSRSTTTSAALYPKSSQLRATQQTNVTSNEKKLHQGQGTSSSDVHNRVWQHCTLEPRKPSTPAQADAMLTSRVGRVDTVRKAVDEAIENDNEIRRKKCMRYLKPPQRFPIPEDMESEETATWINWIHMETQALLEDLNEEIKLQKYSRWPLHKTYCLCTYTVNTEANGISW